MPTASSLAPPERIYIGGLDPPRLTAQDVLNRLPKNCGVEIHSVQGSLDKPYCHVTATPTATSSDKSTSAFAVLFSTFNNVKWKGCRLIVQEARPHFLERLEQERRQRQIELQKDPNDVDMGTTNPIPGKKESQLPRRLRVRKKFGEEAYHVDTKPWLVNDWSTFCRVIDKQRQRKEKQEQKESRDSPLPVMYRAVHIRFDSHDASNINQHGTTDKDANNNHSSPPIGTETSDDSSSESGESVSVRNEKEVGINKAEYAWSDDDDTLDQDVSRLNEGDKGSDASDSDEIRPAITAEHVDQDSSQEDQIVQDSALSASNPLSSRVKSHPGTYDWSSSDDDSSDQSQTVAMQRNRPFMLVTQSDEFDAGFNIHDTGGTTGETEDEEDGAHDSKQENADLSNDVSTNLGILSSLFPDMVDTQPALLDKDPDHGITVNTKTTKVQTKTSGFGASGIMLRYDPNDATTQQFEIVAPEDHVETSKDTGQLKDHNDKEADKEEANTMLTDGAEPMVLYEEKKLEELFREAREAWKAGDKSDKPPNTGGEAAGGMFTFGFDLGQTAAAVPKGSVGFSFGFDLPQVIEQQVPSLALAEPTDKDPEISSLPKLASSIATIPERRRRGFFFSDDVITKYTKHFYSLNNGLKIMKDAEAFRQDPTVKEAWNKERHTLTLDWKRKQKHAQTRIQKKMKIR